ncbi:MAG: NifB/NifX family molybdenum-iron cluster-binding protein [Caldisphaera sp.]|jgi:predicted Fe-Mo cluster-binding NifX family protein
MKVAFPTDDCRSISYGGPGSGKFLVLDFENGGIKNKECRQVNAKHPRERHEHGMHGHGMHEDEDHETDPEHARWHLAVINTLKDVDVILAYHMGRAIVAGLEGLKKKVILGIYFENLNEIINFLNSEEFKELTNSD